MFSPSKVSCYMVYDRLEFISSKLGGRGRGEKNRGEGAGGDQGCLGTIYLIFWWGGGP